MFDAQTTPPRLNSQAPSGIAASAQQPLRSLLLRHHQRCGSTAGSSTGGDTSPAVHGSDDTGGSWLFWYGGGNGSYHDNPMKWI